jgi:hypothetical protein
MKSLVLITCGDGRVLRLASDERLRPMRRRPARRQDFNATIIEACSCPMFCQCYFNARPANRVAAANPTIRLKTRYCRFNNAFRVNHGTERRSSTGRSSGSQETSVRLLPAR